jgi:uncharacterized membrane protein YgcG
MNFFTSFGNWGVRRLVAAALLSLIAAGPALARSIEIDDFDVDIAVDETGGFDVTETLRLRFEGTWNGVIRTIPIQNVTARGERRSLGFRLASVTDDAGAQLEVAQIRRGADLDLKIRVPGASDAVETVVIRYRITGGLRFFDDHDELYWNVTGDEWAFPIHAARARITLPASLVNVRANGFTGGYGARERAVAIRVDGAAHAGDDTFDAAAESPPPDGGHVVEITATKPFGIHEGLTAVVGWNAGVIRRPSASERTFAAGRAWFAGRGVLAAALTVPVLAFLGMFLLWRAVGRDPKAGPLVVEYGPPDDLGPAEVGGLVDNRPDTRDLMAGLVNTAVKGVIRIRETEPKGWFSCAKYAFDLLMPESHWEQAGIPPSGRVMLRGMFKGESNMHPGLDGVIATCTSQGLTDSFYRHLPRIKAAIFDDLEHRGFYRGRPDKTGVFYVALAAGLGVLVWLVMAFAINRAGLRDEVTTLAVPTGLGLATALIVGGFGLIMPARTIAGARVRDRVRGFQEFLRRVETHRLESLPLTPEVFERFLPYAIALGVEHRWATAFAGICTQPPTWYSGSATDRLFDAGDFTSQLGLMTSSTAAAMTSAPRSSGDSGFSGGGGGGGGFSGGGDGGGGGSGW